MSGQTPPPGSPWTSNYAGPGAHVGMQAGHIQDSVVNNNYGVGASPEETYATGVRCLQEGIPSKARELIDEAIRGGMQNAEVRFHWVLAMLSNRSLRDLSAEEHARLETAVTNFRNETTAGPFANALQAVGVLLDHLRDGDGEADAVEKQILALPPKMLDKINRHLGLVLSGFGTERLWEEAKKRAEAERFAGERSNRVWAYFHPIPVRPRRYLSPSGHRAPARGPREILVECAFVLMVASLGWSALTSLNAVMIIAFPITLAAGILGFGDVFEWCYRRDQIRVEDRRRWETPASAHDPQETGFAGGVRNSFEFYFRTYRPHDLDPEQWLAETDGVRGYLGREIADVYRESRIPVDRVNWLISHLATEVRRQYVAGTLYDYRTRLQVPSRTKVRGALSLGLALIALLALFAAALAGDRLVIVAAAISGFFATRNWYRLFRVRRGGRDDAAEAELRYVSRMDAYDRWKQKLADLRPEEAEMETWLRSDITALIQDALDEVRWSWPDVISHAVLRGPAKGRVRRRAPGGPWRYSKYRLHTFLVTEDGIREVVSELDFVNAEFGGQSCRNFQLDAISSVEVDKGTDGSRVLGLTLTNGPTKTIQVTEGSHTETEPAHAMGDGAEEGTGEGSGESTPDQLEMNLDAAGFEHALRLLEGIGAEGKGWIERNRNNRKQ